MNKFEHFHNRYIKGTPPQGIVFLDKLLVTSLSESIQSVLDLPTTKVYISSKVIKHIYDRRLAMHFDYILSHLEELITNPDRIYLNKKGGELEFLFVTNFSEDTLCTVLENRKILHDNYSMFENSDHEENQIKTIFYAKDKYYKNCKIINRN